MRKLADLTAETPSMKAGRDPSAIPARPLCGAAAPRRIDAWAEVDPYYVLRNNAARGRCGTAPESTADLFFGTASEESVRDP